MKAGAFAITVFLVILGIHSSNGESMVVPTVAFVSAGVFLLISIWGEDGEA